jgi:hypothetical protein
MIVSTGPTHSTQQKIVQKTIIICILAGCYTRLDGQHNPQRIYHSVIFEVSCILGWGVKFSLTSPWGNFQDTIDYSLTAFFLVLFLAKFSI